MIEVDEGALMKLILLGGLLMGYTLAYAISQITQYYKCKRCIFYEKFNKKIKEIKI